MGSGPAHLLNLSGEAGDDTLIGSSSNTNGASVTNFLSGDTGNHILTGGSATNGASVTNDIHGDEGSDTLISGSGNDTLFGGGGWGSYAETDTFLFGLNSGRDSIGVFAAGSELGHGVIDLSAYGFTSLSEVIAQTQEDGGNSVINLDASNGVTLYSVSASALMSDSFIFA